MIFRHLLFQDSFGICVGLAGVDCQRFSQLDSLSNLPREYGLLDVPGRVVVVVVESHFAPTDAPGVRHRFYAKTDIQERRQRYGLMTNMSASISSLYSFASCLAVFRWEKGGTSKMTHGCTPVDHCNHSCR